MPTGASLREELTRGVLGVGSLAVLERALAVAAAVLFARVLGVEGYGQYGFALAVVTLLTVPTEFGLRELVTRETAAYQARERWSLMRGLVVRATQFGAVAAAVMMGVAGGILLGAGDLLPALDRATFLAAIPLLAVLAAGAVLGGLLRGLRHVIEAKWPMSVLRPALMVAAVAALAWSGVGIGAADAMLVHLAAAGAAVIALAVLCRSRWPSAPRGVEPAYETGAWARSLLPFTGIGGVHILAQKTDILMLGALTTSADVGVYNVVVQGGVLVSFSLVAFNMALGPHVARLYTQGRIAALQRILTASTAIAFVLGLATVAVLGFAGEWLLGSIFGPDFVRGYLPLIVYAGAHLVNAGFGSVGLFLGMTGHETVVLRALTISAAVNVALNAALIPVFGLLGAAIATLVNMLVWNGILAWSIHRKLGLVAGPFPRMRRPGNRNSAS